VLLREALLILGRDYQTLLKRGVPPSSAPNAVPAAPAVPTPAPETPSKKPSITVKSAGGIFRPPDSSPSTTRTKILDSLASDGATTTALSGLVESATAAASAIPRIFLGEGPHSSVTTSPVMKPPVAPSSVFASRAKGIVEGLQNLPNAPVQARDAASNAALHLEARILRRLPSYPRFSLYDWRWWLSGSSVEKAKCSLRGRKIDLWIVESLSYLTAHSLNEDAYGVVQRDVPRVLEALLSFSTALEAYAQDLEKLTSVSQLSASEAAAGGSEEEVRHYLEQRRQNESEAIGQLVGPLLTGLRSGVRLIAGAYGERLEAFKFSPETAERLQAVVDL